MSRERMVLSRHTFNFDKKRRPSDLLLVSVLSFLLHNLESSASFAILFFLLFKYHLHDKRRIFKPCSTTIPPSP